MSSRAAAFGSSWRRRRCACARQRVRPPSPWPDGQGLRRCEACSLGLTGRDGRAGRVGVGARSRDASGILLLGGELLRRGLLGEPVDREGHRLGAGLALPERDRSTSGEHRSHCPARQHRSRTGRCERGAARRARARGGMARRVTRGVASHGQAGDLSCGRDAQGGAGRSRWSTHVVTESRHKVTGSGGVG